MPDNNIAPNIVIIISFFVPKTHYIDTNIPPNICILTLKIQIRALVKFQHCQFPCPPVIPIYYNIIGTFKTFTHMIYRISLNIARLIRITNTSSSQHRSGGQLSSFPLSNYIPLPPPSPTAAAAVVCIISHTHTQYLRIYIPVRTGRIRTYSIAAEAETTTTTIN